MTSPEKLRANRENARTSTGPTSAAGKRRACQNARRHGLSVPIHLQPNLSEQAENLAHKIAGEAASSEILELANQVAEAQVDVLRVRQARLDLLSGDSNPPERGPDPTLGLQLKAIKVLERCLRGFDSTHALNHILCSSLQVSEDVKPELAERFLTKEFFALDRYERRALSRRKFAIRRLDAARRTELSESKTVSDS
jgi:hypothetical protein